MRDAGSETQQELQIYTTAGRKSFLKNPAPDFSPVTAFAIPSKTGKYKSPLSKNLMDANTTTYDLSCGMLTKIE
jgi:hypothetical protein